MPKKEKPIKQTSENIQLQNTAEIEKKIEEITNYLSLLPSSEKINELNLNYHNLKTNIEEQLQKIQDLYKNIDNLSANIAEIEKNLLDIQKYKEEINLKYEELKNLSSYVNEILSKLQSIEEFRKDLFLFKEKIPLIDHVIQQLSIIEEYYIEQKSKLEKINQDSLSLEREIISLSNQLESKIESKISEFIENYQLKIDEAQTLKILEIDQKINEIIQLMESKTEEKIIEYVTNLQSQIDSAQTEKISDIENKLNNLKNELTHTVNTILFDKINTIIQNYKDSLLPDINNKISEFSSKLYEYDNKLSEYSNLIKEVENKFLKISQDIEANINISIDKILQNLHNLEQKESLVNHRMDDLEKKYNDFVNLVENISEKIIAIFSKPKEEINLTYSENIPYNIEKLLQLMNREDIKADYLILKSGNRPILKSKKALAAVGKIYLKNGDVFNFICEILNPIELNYLKINNNIESIKTINEEKYLLTCEKIFDDYSLIIKRIAYANQDISITSIINPDSLISKISNLTLLLGINSLKNSFLSTIINYINQKQIRRIAIIEEKVSFLYKEQQSIIDIYQFEGNIDKLQSLIKKANNGDYDIIVINTPNLDHKTLRIIANYSNYRSFLLSIDYKDIISFYKEYRDIGEDLINPLKIYINHHVIKSSLHLPEIIFVDNKIKELIKQENLKDLKEYITSIEETETQTIIESIGYLVKNGKLTREEAQKYIINPYEIESSNLQENEIEE